jgi:hypothetical protein
MTCNRMLQYYIKEVIHLLVIRLDKNMGLYFDLCNEFLELLPDRRIQVKIRVCKTKKASNLLVSVTNEQQGNRSQRTR